MLAGKSCLAVAVVTSDEAEHEPIAHVGPGKCHDCCTPAGGFHHPGCDMERCPKCGGQLITCGCLLERLSEEE